MIGWDPASHHRLASMEWIPPYSKEYRTLRASKGSSFVKQAGWKDQMLKPAPGQSSRILVSLAFCMALQMTGFIMILLLFARRFESYGAGVEALAVSATAYALTSAFAAPFIGRLADRFGRRPIILISLTGYVLVFCGYLFAASTWLLILLRALSGIFTAGLIPAMMSIVGDRAPEAQRARWFGVINGSASIGWVIGPFIGGVLFDDYGYEVPFTVSVVLALSALFLALFLIPETRVPADKSVPARSLRGLALPDLTSRPVLFLLLIISFGVVFAYAFIEPQLMFYAYDDLAWSSSRLGLAMSAYGVAFTVGEFSLGRLSDRLGRKPVLVLGLVLFSAQFIGLVFFRDFFWITLSFILAGLGNALYDPALCAQILDISPAGHTAGLIGLKSMAGSLGSLLGPSLVVLAAPVMRPQTVFSIAAVLALILAAASGFGFHPPEGVGKARNFSDTAFER